MVKQRVLSSYCARQTTGCFLFWRAVSSLPVLALPSSTPAVRPAPLPQREPGGTGGPGWPHPSCGTPSPSPHPGHAVSIRKHEEVDLLAALCRCKRFCSSCFWFGVVPFLIGLTAK